MVIKPVTLKPTNGGIRLGSKSDPKNISSDNNDKRA